MMPKKFADTFLEVTNGELLSGSDFDGIQRTYLEPPPSSTYKLESNGYWDIFFYDRETPVYREHTTEKRVTSETRIRSPKIKGLFIREFVDKWTLASLYHEEMFYKGGTWEWIYPFVASWSTRASELYKNLIDDILPLFKESDREQVKYRMLAETVGECVNGMVYIFATGMSQDISASKKAFGLTDVPQLKIDTWTHCANLVDAWIAEANVYRKEQQLRRHVKDLENIKAGHYTKIVFHHPDDRRSIRQWCMPPTSQIVKAFLQEREAALNPAPTPYETVSVKVHPSTMMFIHGTQKVSQLAGCLHVGDTTASTDERVLLLDKLEGYKPKFVSPKAAKPNSIDADIALQEKRLMQCAEQVSQQSVEELLQLTKDATKLLSMVYMRYKNSLNAKDEPSYFGWFKPASLTDKESYYEVFAFYMENIFHKCLVPLLRLATSEPAFYELALRDAMRTSSALVEFSHDLGACDTPTLQRASRQLAEIQSLHESSDASHVNDGFNNGLRHRLVKG